MFATIRRCVARKIQVRSSKVKVTLRGQRLKNGSNFRVRSVTLSFFHGFQNYLAEMFATMRRCVTRKIQVGSSKVEAGGICVCDTFLVFLGNLQNQFLNNQQIDLKKTL